jgi:hypothetical protein
MIPGLICLNGFRRRRCQQEKEIKGAASGTNVRSPGGFVEVLIGVPSGAITVVVIGAALIGVTCGTAIDDT